ncbi:MAG: sigma-70 family RNA polymerase sigma factor [Candidatus Firestonebacteria bacterium]
MKKKKIPAQVIEFEKKKTFAGDILKIYLSEIGKFPLLTQEDEVRLFKKALKDNQAKKIIINSNLRLVVNIAKRYTRFGVSIMDLIEEGNLGLIKAVAKFKIQKGFRFSTYATWWIKQYIIRALSSQGRSIHLPAHIIEILNKYVKITSGMAQKLGREPNIDEVAKKLKLTVEKARKIIEISEMPISLDLYSPDENDKRSIEDIIEDRSSMTPSESHITTMQTESIDKILSMLNSRESRVLELRFGLKNGAAHSLAETGNIYKISRERVRQIELRALKKLRHLLGTKEKEVGDFLRAE